jgi:hypothetical protein
MAHVGSYASPHTRERLYTALMELRDLAYVAARDQGNVTYRMALERTAERFDAQAKALVAYS